MRKSLPKWIGALIVSVAVGAVMLGGQCGCANLAASQVGAEGPTWVFIDSAGRYQDPDIYRCRDYPDGPHCVRAKVISEWEKRPQQLPAAASQPVR